MERERVRRWWPRRWLAAGGPSAAVELRGGTLEIEWRNGAGQDGHVLMTGEAVEVFKGQVEVGAEEVAAVR